MTTPTLKIKVLPKPTIKGKMDVRFPANVETESPILLDKTGGTYNFSLDMDEVTSNIGIHDAEFDTRGDVQGAVIHSSVHAIRTGGYYTAGDGGAALYKRVASEPSHEGKILSGDGSWWEIAEANINVQMFGARADGASDDTNAIQSAINFAYTKGGGAVSMPAATYYTTGKIDHKAGVTLEGVWRAPPPTPINISDGTYSAYRGTEILVTHGAASTDVAESFITLHSGSHVKGIFFFYPNQTKTSPPVSYPPTIYIAPVTEDFGISDCMFLNSFVAIRSNDTSNFRGNIQNITGQPLNTGIYLNAFYDTPKIDNIHFYPFWTGFNMATATTNYMLANARSYVFARVDAAMVGRIFALGYKDGLTFVDDGQGSTFGQFDQVYMESCVNSINARVVAGGGITIASARLASNGQNNVGTNSVALRVADTSGRLYIGAGLFSSINGDAKYQVEVEAGAAGAVSLGPGVTIYDWTTAGINMLSASASLRVFGSEFAQSGGYTIDVSTLTSAATNTKMFVGGIYNGGFRVNWNASHTPIQLLLPPADIGSANRVQHSSSTGLGPPTYSLVDLSADTTGRAPYGSLPLGNGLSVMGVTGSSSNNYAAITGAADQILRVDGAATTMSFGSIDLSKSAAVGTSILPVANGGTGASSASAARTSLGVPTGTSGHTLPFLDGSNTWSAGQTFLNAVNVGDGTTSREVAILAPTSGTGAGGNFAVRLGGVFSIGFGNKSYILGGAYDATPMIYSVAPVEHNQAIKVTDATASTSTATGSGIFAGGVGVAGRVVTGDGVQTPIVAVASLPAASATTAGLRYVVNNANSTTFLSTVAGGGANIVPVFCDGTNWKIG